ncbi:hypothetical protein M3Y97_00464100 [Aphelenchoides bicaudatus]|nr:hypothetical protein M3Y97_00464100 [Aphelenchoides bicaudatus]
MSKPTIKYGSAPASSTIDPSTWRSSPLRKPSKGMIGIESDRRFGVLHRIDSQIGFHSSNHLDRIEQMRCPSCRMNGRQLLCSSCVNTTLRLARVRDVNRELFLRKAEICRRIDDELQSKMHFQSDLYAKTRAIRQLKQKIAEKTEMNGRLRRSLALTEVKIAKSSKNVQTLENAAARHSKLIEEKTMRNQELLAGLETIREENLRYNRFFTILLAHYFPLKKLELSARKQKPGESMIQSTVSTSAPKVWPPVKRHYFTINGCEINENSQYDRLENELGCWFPAGLVQTSTSVVRCSPVFVSVLELSRLSARLHPTLSTAFARTGSLQSLSTSRGLLTEQMKQKLEAAFKQLTYEERQQDFNLEQVEEDWVSVEMI